MTALDDGFLTRLEAIIASRIVKDEDGSYTAELARAGTARIAKKVGEEGVEVALAAVADDGDALLDEAADLIYHLLVLLHVRNLDLAAVAHRLEARHAG